MSVEGMSFRLAGRVFRLAAGISENCSNFGSRIVVVTVEVVVVVGVGVQSTNQVLASPML